MLPQIERGHGLERTVFLFQLATSIWDGYKAHTTSPFAWSLFPLGQDRLGEMRSSRMLPNFRTWGRVLRTDTCAAGPENSGVVAVDYDPKLASPVLHCADGYLATGTWVAALLAGCRSGAGNGRGVDGVPKARYPAARYRVAAWHEYCR